MANYIGNQLKNGEFKKLDSIASSFDGSTTTFNLTFNGTSVQIGDAVQLIVSLNGVIQEPVVAYTLANAGSQIVFSTAPASGASCFISYLGGIAAVAQTVADDSITTSKIADNSITADKIVAGAVVADIADASITPAKLDRTYLTPTGDGSQLTGIDALPSQTGESGNYLTTDGTNASWAALDTDANSTTKGMYEHSASISANYSIASGNNAMSAGPVTIDTGITVTIPAGSNWTIV